MFPTTALSALHVLLVDDDPFFSELMVAMLHSIGVMQVEHVADGKQGLRRLENKPPIDVIISDLHMPEMDGIELLRHLAAMHYGGAVILLSGLESKILKTAEDLAHAHQLHLLGVLPKPIPRHDLAAQLARAWEYWTPERKEAAARRSVEELREGISRGELTVHVQPRIRISDGQITGVEALVRWQHPSGPITYPDHFLPLAEATGLMMPLTHAVVEQTLQLAAQWQTQGIMPQLSLNVTAEIVQDVDFPDWLTACCARHGIPADRLILEMTESQLMEHLALSLDTLVRLRLKGSTLSVDDFGTGYSNLAQLKRAPFSELKIDRSFVVGGMQDADGEAILAASIDLGKKLGLCVVAEGVETQEQWDMVARLGADEVQGFFIARPMPSAALPNWLASRQNS